MKKTRSKKLIDSPFQLYLIGSFLGLTILALLFQFVLFANTMARLADDLPNDGELLLKASTSALVRTSLLSFFVALPATLSVGLLVTNRVAGPLYRFRSYLRDLRSGEASGPCTIRKGDQLQDLCDEINATGEALRQQGSKRTNEAA